MELEELKKDQRVEISPACDAWMQGDRYGTVVKIGRKYAHLKMDRSGRTLQFSPQNIMHTV